MSAEYSVHFEVEAQAQEKKIKEQLIALGLDCSKARTSKLK
jgi:hypothetical protein